MKVKRKLYRWFYYRLVRIRIKSRLRNRAYKLTRVQDKAMKIIMTLMYDSDAQLLINPAISNLVGERYYIKKSDEKGNVEKFITISRTSGGYNASIIVHEKSTTFDHSFHYEIFYNDVSGGMIIDKFMRAVRRRRNKMEIYLRKDYEKSLDMINRNMKK